MIVSTGDPDGIFVDYAVKSWTLKFWQNLFVLITFFLMKHRVDVSCPQVKLGRLSRWLCVDALSISHWYSH